jgi:hypothetical protein
MHRTDKKNAFYGIFIYMIAVLINLHCFNVSSWFVPILGGVIIFAHKKLLEGFLSGIVYASIVSILVNVIILTIIYLMLSRFLHKPYVNYVVIISAVLAFFVLFVLLSISSRFDKLLLFIKKEEQYFDKIPDYPNLICRKHLSKITLKKCLVIKIFNAGLTRVAMKMTLFTQNN